jgi:hypothetical protein
MLSYTNHVALPETVDCAVSRILELLSFRERAMLAQLDDWQTSLLGKLLIEYLQLQLMETSLSQALLEDCRNKTGEAAVDAPQAAAVIVANVWNRLRETHRLRVVG